jgi:hypothetical protein
MIKVSSSYYSNKTRKKKTRKEKKVRATAIYFFFRENQSKHTLFFRTILTNYQQIISIKVKIT